MTLKDHASGPGVNPRDNFFEHGVVVVIATAGAEATLLLGQEDQTSVLTASDNEGGTHIDTIQMADRTTILLRRGTTRTNTWYT